MARSRTSWARGRSGNPAGMPRGTERKVTRLVRKLSEQATPEIVEGIIKDALAGDAQARALFLKYLAPALPRPTPTPIKLTAPKSGEEALAQIAQLAGGLARGELDLEASRLVIDSLHTYLVGTPIGDLEAKFRELGLLMLERQGKP